MSLQQRETGTHQFHLPTIHLQSGEKLHHGVLSYDTSGRLNQTRDNAVLICHALTGDSHVREREGKPGWWDGLIGPGKALDPHRYFTICANVLGGCYGSSGPASLHPDDGKPYGLRFPLITIRDMVHAQHHLIKSLGITRLQAVIGGSMGGMQVFEWAVTYPDWVEAYIPIATSHRFSAMGIAFNHVMRQAIYHDPDWCNGFYYGRTFPTKGLSLARRLAMITYRSFALYEERFGQTMSSSCNPFTMESEYEVERYLQYQGGKLVQRFDANTYLYLLKAMDLHDIAQGRGDERSAFAQITGRGLLIGIDTDVLFPAQEMQMVAQKLQTLNKTVVYREIQSVHGHDAFLIEFDQLNKWINEFLLRKGGL